MTLRPPLWGFFAGWVLWLSLVPLAYGQPDPARMLGLAQSFAGAGQYERAIRLLEDLLKTDSTSFVVFQRLEEAYRETRRYDDALRLVDARLVRFPGDLGLRSQRAALLHLTGQEQAALRTWQSLLDEEPTNPLRYQMVYFAMVQQRLVPQAIEVLQQGLRRVPERSNFYRDLGYLYSVQGSFTEAAEAFVRVLELEPTQTAFVRSRLAPFTENGAAPLADVFERAVRRLPTSRPHREVLGWLYIEAGEYARAFDTYRALDRLSRDEGMSLYSFAALARSAKAFGPARDAYEEMLRRYPDGPAAPDALFALGQVYEDWAREAPEHYPTAAQAYATFAERHPAHPALADVLQRLGMLQMDVLRDFPAAERTLSLAEQRFGGSGPGERASFDLARLALLQNRLDDAALRFSRIEERIRIGELAEMARLERAYLHFYAGEFEASRRLVYLLSDNTTSDISNDAILLRVLLSEGIGQDSNLVPLTRFARAHLLKRQLNVEAARDSLAQLWRDVPNHLISDEIAFLLASTQRETGQPEQAIETLTTLRSRYAQSFLADRALREVARIQEVDLRQPDVARQTLLRVLEEHPGSLLVPEVRADIRRLRGETLL